MFRKLIASWLNRQVAQHGSMGAVVLGLVCNLLGVPLAGEQISLLITAGSVVLYIVSQVRALWHPPQTPTPPPRLMGLLLVLALLGAAPRARADSYALVVLHPTEYTDNGGPSTAIPAAWTIYTAVDCGPSAQPASDWSYVVTIASPASSATVDVPAGFYCAAHSTFTAKGEGAFSAFGNVVQLPAASASPLVVPTLSAAPGAPSLTVTRQ